MPGTIHTAVAAIREGGGHAVGVLGDVHSEDDVTRLVETAVAEFGGAVDVVVNNASASTPAAA
ncbi:MAG: SDR family NAD(P)-dependent oxidoreductase [Deltaproteobacteria bacterium]|nr:MAG: SDR family NAD(P)-dependent oxidoreductase [Deltaproteobacteria bacterium]